MGMFDYLRCDYPLPGEPVELVGEYQTKDFGCTLATIIITADGTLDEEARDDTKWPFSNIADNYDNFTGVVEFYGSTISACGPVGEYTYDGEDAESVTFEATFVDGKLTKIEQVHYERKTALSTKDMPQFFERRGIETELDENDSFVGKKLFLLWGGRQAEEGSYVEVVHETEQELCYKDEKGRLETIDRFQIGNLLFKDFDEAKADREAAAQQLEEQKAEHARKLEEKIEKRKDKMDRPQD